MTGPLKKINAELTQENPALQAFVDYIRTHQGSAPLPEEIQIIPSDPREGAALTLNYIEAGCRPGKPCRSFYARISPHQPTIEMRHGWGILAQDALGPLVVPAKNEAGKPQEELAWVDGGKSWPVEGTCDAWKELTAGTARNISCLNLSRQRLVDLGQKTGWFGGALFSLWSWPEFLSLMRRPGKRWPASRFIARQLSRVGTQKIDPFTRHNQILPGLIAGGLGMAGAQYLAGQLGMDPLWHREERFKFGVVAGHSLNALVHGYTNVFPHLPPSETISLGKILMGHPEASRTFPEIPPYVRRMSLGSGLLSAALVDATVGSAFAEGSHTRELIRGAGFFLPQVYLGVMGTRRFVLGQNPKVAAAGKWAGRIAVAAFLSDTAYSVYRLFHLGETEVGWEHQLYGRAQQLQELQEGDSLWRGVLKMLAPSLTEQYTVSPNYVLEAKKELLPEAATIVTNTLAFLRHELIEGDSGENRSADFYRSVDLYSWEWKNPIDTVYLADGVELPVEQLSKRFGERPLDPEKNQEAVEEKQIAELQDYFSGWPLSPLDVGAAYGQLAHYRVQNLLGQLHHVTTPSETPFAAHFDKEGKLLPAEENKLLWDVFPELQQIQPEVMRQQILALRITALQVRIQRLREDLKTAEANLLDPRMRKNAEGIKRNLETFSRIAKEIGVMDKDGQFLPGETTDFAERIHARDPQPKVEKNYSDQDMLRDVMGLSGENAK